MKDRKKNIEALKKQIVELKDKRYQYSMELDKIDKAIHKTLQEYSKLIETKEEV